MILAEITAPAQHSTAQHSTAQGSQQRDTCHIESLIDRGLTLEKINYNFN